MKLHIPMTSTMYSLEMYEKNVTINKKTVPNNTPPCRNELGRMSGPIPRAKLLATNSAWYLFMES